MSGGAEDANPTQLNVPYHVLLAEYQDRVGALTNENVMLRATIAHMQRTTAAHTAAPAADAPAQPADAEG